MPKILLIQRLAMIWLVPVLIFAENFQVEKLKLPVGLSSFRYDPTPRILS